MNMAHPFPLGLDWLLIDYSGFSGPHGQKPELVFPARAVVGPHAPRHISGSEGRSRGQRLASLQRCDG